LHADVLDPADRRQDRRDLFRLLPQHVEIVAEELRRRFGPDARNQFVDPLLNRLAQQEARAGNPFQAPADLLHQLRFVAGRRPFVQWPERDHRVAFVRLLGIVPQLRTSDFRHNHRDLGELHDRPLHLLLDFDRFLERGARQPDGLRREGAFVEDRDKLAAEKRHQQKAGAEERHGAKQHGSPSPQRPLQGGEIDAFGPADQKRVVLAPPLERQGAQDRRQGQRQDQGHEQRDHDRVGQRLEHFAFHPLQREEREEHDDDDQHPEDHRLADFLARLEDQLDSIDGLRSVFGQMAVHVLHHDDRSVHDHADRDGQTAEGHEVGGEARLAHDDERHERRQDEGCGDDQGAPDVAEKQKEDDDDQDDSLHQRLVDGIERRGDELNAVIEGDDPKPRRQQVLLLDFGDLRFESLDHVPGVPAPQHQDDAGHDLPLAVQHGGPMANGVADLYLGHVADVHRGAADFLDHDVPNVLQRFDEADAAHDVLFGVLFEDVAAGVGVVLGDRFEYVMERQIVLAEQAGFHHDLVLLDESAQRIDVHHFGDALEQRPDDPILNGPHVDQVLLVEVLRLARKLRRLDVILKHFSESGCVGDHHRLGAGRQRVPHLDQPFKDQLSREVDVHAGFEDDRDERQADFRQGAQLGERRHPRQLQLDRKGDEPFDLGRRQPRRLGHDLDEDAGDGGERVDRNGPERVHAAGGQQERGDHDEDALAK